jgi:hypothetical protein
LSLEDSQMSEQKSIPPEEPEKSSGAHKIADALNDILALGTGKGRFVVQRVKDGEVVERYDDERARAKAENAEIGRRYAEQHGMSPRALELALQAPGAQRLREFCAADPDNRAALQAFLSAVFARGG